MPQPKSRQVPALEVHQWLKGWDQVEFSADTHRRKPLPYFYLFSLPAIELRSLCGIVRRDASHMTPRGVDLGIQRQHERERSDEIGQFVQFGYPWSTLSESKRASSEFDDLRKPGWLPTAIVINILQRSDSRGQKSVHADDLITIDSSNGGSRLTLPYKTWSKDWRPSSVAPLEVIDGQHRLWAFESNADANFELPVVAFYGLDTSWQAYLFWTINIKPKRINPSLAFDLYPLLRAEDWLDRGEGHLVYRETRSQELVEALWSNPKSPWYDRINMLGEKQNRWVSQSAWIRTLMATLVRKWEGRLPKTGGLFGSRIEEGADVLGWNRAQQAAFLIFSWRELRSAVHKSKDSWANTLRLDAKDKQKTFAEDDDPAFYGRYSLIATDQGVRGYLHAVNDLCFILAPSLDLLSWQIKKEAGANDVGAVDAAMGELKSHSLGLFLGQIADRLGDFDWRTSSYPKLSAAERRLKLVFRGSSGYKELRDQLLAHLEKKDGAIADAAKRLRTVT
jgi:hypothetical protein